MAGTIIRVTAAGAVTTEECVLRKITWLPTDPDQIIDIRDSAGNRIVYDTVAATASYDAVHERHYDFGGDGFIVDGITVTTITSGSLAGLFII